MLTNNMRSHHWFHQMTNLLRSSSVWVNLSWSFETINVCYDVIELIVFERDDYIKQIEIGKERNERQNNWSWKIIINQEWGRNQTRVETKRVVSKKKRVNFYQWISMFEIDVKVKTNCDEMKLNCFVLIIVS